MRNSFINQLKFYTLFGTLNEQRVANGILYFKETREEEKNKIEIEDKETLLLNSLPNNKFMNDYSTAQSRLGSHAPFTFIEKLSLWIMGLSFLAIISSFFI